MSILISLAFNNNVEEFHCRKLQLFLLRRVCACVLPVICFFCGLLPPPAVAEFGIPFVNTEKDKEFGAGLGLAAGRMLQINTTLQSLTILCELLLSQTFMTIFVQSLVVVDFLFFPVNTANSFGINAISDGISRLASEEVCRLFEGLHHNCALTELNITSEAPCALLAFCFGTNLQAAILLILSDFTAFSYFLYGKRRKFCFV
jgi:hypothetical protein